MSNNRLLAPGRLDVVEQVLSTDPFFKSKMRRYAVKRLTNRRNRRKSYSGLTIRVVTNMAQAGLDAVNMRRDEILAKAFEVVELKLAPA